MPRDPRYDILFEPVRIGPVTAKNRFYQVPHCNGMGWRMPRGRWPRCAAIKAEGGWAVVCTEQMRDPSDRRHRAVSSKLALWDDAGHPGARADGRRGASPTARSPAIELVHNGLTCPNLYIARAAARAGATSRSAD